MISNIIKRLYSQDNLVEHLNSILVERMNKCNKDKQWDTALVEDCIDETLTFFGELTLKEDKVFNDTPALPAWLRDVKGYDGRKIKKLFRSKLTPEMRADLTEWADKYFGDSISEDRYTRQLVQL